MPDGAPFPFSISVAGGGSQLWMIDGRDASLARLDPTSGQVVERIPVTVAPPSVVTDVFALVQDAGTLWAVAATQTARPVGIEATPGVGCCDALEAQVLVRVDVETQQVAQLHQLDGALAVAIGFESVWVLESPEETAGHFILVRLHPRTGVPVATMGLPDFDVGPTGCRPCVAGPRMGSDAVWLALGPAGRVIRIDPAQNRIEAEIDVGETITDLAVGPDGSVWVVGARALDGACLPSTGFVARIDPGRNEMAARTPVDCPVSVVVSRGDVWVGGYDGGTAVVERIRPTP